MSQFNSHTFSNKDTSLIRTLLCPKLSGMEQFGCNFISLKYGVCCKMTLATCEHSLRTFCPLQCVPVCVTLLVCPGGMALPSCSLHLFHLPHCPCVPDLSHNGHCRQEDTRFATDLCCHTCSCAPVPYDSMLRSHSQTIVGGIWE